MPLREVYCCPSASLVTTLYACVKNFTATALYFPNIDLRTRTVVVPVVGDLETLRHLMVGCLVLSVFLSCQLLPHLPPASSSERTLAGLALGTFLPLHHPADPRQAAGAAACVADVGCGVRGSSSLLGALEGLGLRAFSLGLGGEAPRTCKVWTPCPSLPIPPHPCPFPPSLFLYQHHQYSEASQAGGLCKRYTTFLGGTES